MRVLNSDSLKHIDSTITVNGWVHSVRNHGGLIFVDLRDHTGILQTVINPNNNQLADVANELRDEYVVSVTGKVVQRDENLKNKNSELGEVELVCDEVRVLNKSEVLPIQPFAEQQANEDLRLKYRFLDLRREKMQKMLRARALFTKTMHEYMQSNDFLEVATPILANSSPEGARDFLVPARLHPGKFYALPQAPQQFKQLLMVGGVPRYYQIAAVFRDEDTRADRLYGEFYQLDAEMSFVYDGEEVRSMFDPLILKLVKMYGKTLLGGKVQRMTHHEAMEEYGSDKPDLRYEMKLVELSDTLTKSGFGVFNSVDCVKAICVKGGAGLSRKQIDKFTDVAKSKGAGGLAYLMYKDGAVQSPIAKFLTESELSEIQQKTGAVDGDAVFFGADKREVVNKVLGQLRISFADHYNLKDPNVISYLWVVDFPFYEWNESENRVDFGHNPFSMPKGGLEALESAKTDEEKLGIKADQYDAVMNGYEISSGAIRNYNPEVLYKAFEVVGYDRGYVEEKFSAMLNAFKYGAPPHGGVAFGVDRVLMELMNEENVREVVAFPKNGSGMDVLMNSPSYVDDFQLKELGLNKPKSKKD